MPLELTDRFQFAEAFLPLDLQTARDGDWISLKNARMAWALVYKGVGTAGDDPTFTIEQATDVSGTSAKNFSQVDRYYSKQAATNLQSTGQFTRTTQTAAATVTNTDMAEQALFLIIPIDPRKLDIANGFDCVRIRCSDVGTNAQLGCAFYMVESQVRAGVNTPSIIGN